MNKWELFRADVFKQIFNIIENCNCLSYKIMGYKYLDIKLILRFDDCYQVYLFENIEDEPIRITKFFTKDHNNEEPSPATLFTTEWDREVAE